MKHDDDDKYVPVDFSSGLPLVINGQEIGVPATLDLEYINKQVFKIKNNPSMIGTYLDVLRSKFKLNRQIVLINQLEEYCKALSGGMASQVELEKQRSALLSAQRDTVIAREDLTDIQEDLAIRKLTRQLEIAKIKKQIRETEGSPKPESEVDKFKTLKESLSDKIREQTIKDDYNIRKTINKFKKEFKTKQALRMAMEQIKQDIMNDTFLSPGERERELENLNDYYDAMLDMSFGE